jgi:hypothetical protein
VITRALTIITGCILALQDILFGKVHVLWLFGLMASCCADGVLEHREPCFIPFLVILAVGCIYFAIRHENGLGFADYFVAFSMSFLCKAEYWPWFLMICGALGILTCLICKCKKFPFIPAILASGFIISLL